MQGKSALLVGDVMKTKCCLLSEKRKLQQWIHRLNISTQYQFVAILSHASRKMYSAQFHKFDSMDGNGMKTLDEQWK